MTPTHRHRPERVAALIHQTLADALQTQLKDPRIGFVTVTCVEMSPDLGHAVVRVSVMGSAEEKARAMEGLDSAKGFLRSHLGHTLTLRVVPELHFHLDRGLEHATRINEILSHLKDAGQS